MGRRRRALPAVAAAAGGGQVVAAAASALGPCLVLADAAGRPLRPAILYGIDTRAVAEIEELDERLGAAAILARCGSPLTTQAVGPKLAWLARHEPEVLRATRRLFTASSFLVHRLTGDYVLDHHSASQCVPHVRRAGQRLDRRVGRRGGAAACRCRRSRRCAGPRSPPASSARRPRRRPGCPRASRSPPARSTRWPRRSAPASAAPASCCWPTARPCSWPR